MSVRFSILASGSKGNAALVQAGGVGLLIDAGLGPRVLGRRLLSVGASWDGVAAAVLTHTHADHHNDDSLAEMARRGIVLYCHPEHRPVLGRRAGFAALEAAGLVRDYDDRPFLTPSGLRVEPFAVSHDGGPTYGFRIEGRAGRLARPVALGYLADSGTWTEAMADALVDVDLLGVEFNHDVDLQRNSGRPWHLIRRNLGDGGHLSNDQGAALIEAVVGRSRPGAVRDVVLLHLSEQCNRPALALGAARAVLRRVGRRARVHAARQHEASPHLEVVPARRRQAAPPVSFPWEGAGEVA